MIPLTPGRAGCNLTFHVEQIEALSFIVEIYGK
jgi:hypothetical protein